MFSEAKVTGIIIWRTNLNDREPLQRKRILLCQQLPYISDKQLPCVALRHTAFVHYFYPNHTASRTCHHALCTPCAVPTHLQILPVALQHILTQHGSEDLPCYHLHHIGSKRLACAFLFGQEISHFHHICG